MMASRPKTESIWKLRADLASAKILIWAASIGRDGELTPETHFYLANLYDRLSHAYRVRNCHSKARKLGVLAAAHYRAGGWDGPPYAAAMAMPRPRQWIIVDAVSRQRVDGSGDVA
jgi:hypothetical protein